jgi:alpha-tubulin suppressor-like RCC1 family protein
MRAQVILIGVAIAILGALQWPLGPGEAQAAGGVAVSAGDNHACAVVEGGAVQCWGDNTYGQLGDSGACGTICSTPVTVVGITGATSVSAGGVHTCAVVGNGAVKCWGNNENGALGDNGACGANCFSPVTVSGLTNATSVSAGAFHTCARTSTAAAKCWGSNSYGELGDAQLCGGSCDIPVNVTGLASGVSMISAGFNHTCAVAAGAAKCWGLNEDGQLGDNQACDAYACLTPANVSGLGSGVTGISVGFKLSCAVVSGGAKCWGSNQYGELGDGQACDSVQCNTPADVSGLGSGVSAISAGTQHACARMSSGALTCWGRNQGGQLGDGQACGYYECSTPTSVSVIPSGLSIDAGFHTCAVASDFAVHCWGHNYSSQLGDGGTCLSSSCLVPTPVFGLGNGGTAVDAGPYQSCAIVFSGLQCWGDNSFGQLGDGGGCGPSCDAPVAVTGMTSGMVAVSAGGLHTCGIVISSGSNVLRCWGSNSNGQLGDGQDCGSLSCSTPVDVTGTGEPIAVSAGDNHTCAIDTSNNLYCWGANHSGQLGDGQSCGTTYCSNPVFVTPYATAVAAGNNHTCAALLTGGAKCWGSNYSGELGDGQVCGTVCTTPVTALASTFTVTRIAAGGTHSCGAVSGPIIKCWGNNNVGQIGDGQTCGTFCTTPVDVMSPTSVGALSAGGGHTCTLVDGGTAKCWGYNYYGQIGDGTKTDRTTPTNVSVLGAAGAISAGGDHTCATESGAMFCWGNGVLNTLGIPCLVYCTEPQQVIGLGPLTCPDMDGDLICDDVDPDIDGDGCPNVNEQQTAAGSQTSGGLRDYLNPWDYYNPQQDGVNRVPDINLVVVNYGQDLATPGSTYSTHYDRTPLAGENLWEFGPPNGTIRAFDITAAVYSYGHDCS